MNNWFGPRERILAFGPKTVCDEELLCVLLRTGAKREAGGGPSVLQLAAKLRSHFGSLNGVFAASLEELEAIPGIGKTKAAMLLAVGEIAQRVHTFSNETQPQILRPQDAYRVFIELAREPQESVRAAFLDSQNRLIAKREIFRGTIDASLAQPREILREALRFNASRLVIAHNHPSDHLEPSDEDRTFTQRVFEACEWIGVLLIDHVIIGRGGRYYSFAESGAFDKLSLGVGSGPMSPRRYRSRVPKG